MPRLVLGPHPTSAPQLRSTPATHLHLNVVQVPGKKLVYIHAYVRLTIAPYAFRGLRWGLDVQESLHE